jgi:hypothetical protein
MARRTALALCEPRLSMMTICAQGRDQNLFDVEKEGFASFRAVGDRFGRLQPPRKIAK